jgi:MFS family permease
MGVIIGSSSVAGALFDFLICRFVKRTNHRRILIFMFALCFVYPLILWEAKVFFVYLIAMAIWGLYYDLHNISKFEFIGHNAEKEDHTDSFGLLQVFQSLGYLLAPILAGFVIGEVVGWGSFALAWIFLSISFVFFLVMLKLTKDDKNFGAHCKPINFFVEINLWRSLGKLILPVLVLTLLLNVTDSFFWTIGPIVAEGFPEKYHHFAGFFLAAYSLPPLLVGWFVGNATKKYGKKRTAFASFLAGSIIFSFLFLVDNPVALMLIVFVASCFIAFAWPAINGAYADYIRESKTMEREIEGLEDFFTNLGYVFGPILAGLLADTLGDLGAFSALGLAGVVSALFLLQYAAKAIVIKPKELI